MSFEDYLAVNGIKYQKNAPTDKLCSMRAGGRAAYLVFPSSSEEFIYAISYADRLSIKHRVIGRLTNTLFAAEEYEGVLISTALMKEFGVEGSSVKASAGVPLPLMIRNLAHSGYELLPEISGIPGSVGGAVRNNAGAFGRNVSDALMNAEIYIAAEKRVRILQGSDLSFGYRCSALADGGAYLLSATFSIKTGHPESISEKIRTFDGMRRNKQPSSPSLGSFFKNRGDKASSQMIDECGLKGASVGGARVSEKHAGFIVNDGGATAGDVVLLSDKIRKRVFQKFGKILEYEAEIIF